jgi:hypothetical protein
MASTSPAKLEYSYYVTFVKNTKRKISNSPAVNFLQLNCLLMELMEVLVTKKHDKDDIRFWCCEIMATTALLMTFHTDVHASRAPKIITNGC